MKGKRKKSLFWGYRIPSNHPIKVAGSQKNNSAFFTSKTKKKKKIKITPHMSVLKPLLTSPKKKAVGREEKGSTCLFISLTSEAILTN